MTELVLYEKRLNDVNFRMKIVNATSAPGKGKTSQVLKSQVLSQFSSFQFSKLFFRILKLSPLKCRQFNTLILQLLHFESRSLDFVQSVILKISFQRLHILNHEALRKTSQVLKSRLLFWFSSFQFLKFRSFRILKLELSLEALNFKISTIQYFRCCSLYILSVEAQILPSLEFSRIHFNVSTF